jgi:hypothetical protein
MIAGAKALASSPPWQTPQPGMNEIDSALRATWWAA